MKLAVREPESQALQDRLRDDELLSSALASVELRRALRRSARVQRTADEILGGLHLLAIDAETLGIAAILQPATLGTLDAIHLATAVRVADDLDVFMTYDRRLARAARVAGLQVEAPS